ncbi:YqaJ viral recombinase family protein [Bradyrhizobium cytisi]|uniref:YqaJ viral recombinase family protein n=1 Tax=Bradyrhizobium cytisi TaxID=515489 RepID=A0A5S4WZ65_9BRAD|nr:YqaJ viral recombinase family protein [Bradyrhizobium cytisi]TYL87390.1 YqaJ viral recombinase family protein [Bradyrhizobium cytisi]
MSEFDYQLGKFTGTSANVVMNGGEEEWVQHYLVRSGQIAPEPTNWAMQAGSHMEPLILDWYQDKLGLPITRRGEVVAHPLVADVCAKLDGYIAALDQIIEVKFLSPHRSREEFIPCYYPQTMLQRLCTGASRAALLVAQGTSEPLDFEHPFDGDYATELMKRADIFLNCLRSLTPPYPIPPAPPPPEKWRTVDVVSNPTNWSSELLLFLQSFDDTATAAALHAEMGKAARDLIPDDVGKVFAGAFQITRNRRGNLAITRRAA